MESQEAKEKIVCVCLKEFTEKSIFKHLNHRTNKSCKENFDKEKYESLMAAKKESRKQYHKEYKETNAPRFREREKIKYAENPSPAKKRAKNCRAVNKETISQKKKKTYSQNRETISQKRKESYSQNKETISQKRKENYSQNELLPARTIRIISRFAMDKNVSVYS